MKVKFTLLFSLGLNALLLAGIGWHWSGNRLQAEVEGVPKVSANTPANKRDASGPPVMVNVHSTPFSWSELAGDDYAQYVRNLRAAGCPEITVQDIIYAEVDKSYARKIRGLNRELRIGRDGNSLDYWKSYRASHQALTERTRQLLALNRERDGLLFSLLGVDVEKERRIRHGQPDIMASQLAFLAPQQIQQAKEITARFDELDRVAQVKYGGYTGPEPYAEMAELARERETELLKVMSASQLTEYKLRQSPVAFWLREKLQSVPITEQEFRALYLIQEKYHQPFQPPRNLDDPVVFKQVQDQATRRLSELALAVHSPKYREYVIDLLR